MNRGSVGSRRDVHLVHVRFDDLQTPAALVNGAEFLPALWRAGIRGYHAVFNVPGDDVRAIVGGYRASLDALAGGGRSDPEVVRRTLGTKFTRGHFARAV